MNLSELRVALVHYWYVRRRGGERVFDVLADMFPQAHIFIMVADRESLPPAITSHKVQTSFIQKIPGATRHYRKMLPLFPLALEGFDLSNYDLVISQEAGPTKGVLTRSRTCHINYCHSPLRYVWEMYHDYKAQAPGGALGRALYALSAHYVRQWDLAAARRVDYFIGSSRNAALRIRKYYGRESDIVYPPVELGRFAPDANGRDDFYLMVSPLVGYKRVDLAIQACNALNRKLVVIGTGEQMPYLKSIAGPNVQLLGFQNDDVVRGYYSRCRAFLFPGEEDIGLTPIEAQASGAPVIAFGAGGALETVRGFYPEQGYMAGSTGVFFREQSIQSMKDSILAFEAAEQRFETRELVSQASRFGIGEFKDQMTAMVSECYSRFQQAQLR